jgi:hypothetical protein
VFLGPKTYEESVTIEGTYDVANPGVLTNNPRIWVVGAGRDQTTIVGTGDDHHVISHSEADNTGIVGLTMVGGGRNGLDATLTSGASYCHLRATGTETGLGVHGQDNLIRDVEVLAPILDGVRSLGGDLFLLEQVVVTSPGHNGIHFQEDGYGNGSNSNTIRNSQVTGAGNDGIAIVGDYNHVLNNEIEGSAASGIYFARKNSTFAGNILRNNTFGIYVEKRPSNQPLPPTSGNSIVPSASRPNSFECNAINGLLFVDDPTVQGNVESGSIVEHSGLGNWVAGEDGPPCDPALGMNCVDPASIGNCQP